MERSLDLLTRPLPGFDHCLRYGDAPSQFGELRLPRGDGPHPVVVGIHGGWWRAAHGVETHAHLCAALTALGFATWNIEYRRIGEDGGGWSGTLADTGLAIDFLTTIAPRFNLDLSRVVTIGFSAGGQLALWAAARPQFDQANPLWTSTPLALSGAISLAGAVDLILCSEMKLSEGIVDVFLGGDPAEVPERYNAASPKELLPLGTPHILIHGTQDTSVPHSVSESYFTKARELKGKCELFLLQGIQHFELIDPLAPPWETVTKSVRALTGFHPEDWISCCRCRL